MGDVAGYTSALYYNINICYLITADRLKYMNDGSAKSNVSTKVFSALKKCNKSRYSIEENQQTSFNMLLAEFHF